MVYLIMMIMIIFIKRQNLSEISYLALFNTERKKFPLLHTKSRINYSSNAIENENALNPDITVQRFCELRML